MSLSPGACLGPYEILAPIGAGGMGEVYRARDSRLGRDVALKVLPPEFAADSQRRARFEQEARAASALNHPHIVSIFDIGSSEAGLYVAMELVEGKTLRESLESGRIPVSRTLELGTQIAEGLARAHSAGIVHRDLKPENVMIARDGFAKILDFGLAKIAPARSADASSLPTMAPQATDAGTVLGTVGYMSPEQASGRSVDFRSDQFSLGTLIYEMAAGKRPFHHATAAQTMAAIIQEDPEPIATLNAKVPPPLRWIVDRCLAKDPEARYASTTDLARELKSLRDHLSEATSAAALAEAPAARRRTPPLAWAAAAVIAVAAAALLSRRLALQAHPATTAAVFHRLTFRRGLINSARFASDGQTIVYSAAWDGRPAEIFTTRSGSTESRSLSLPGADVLSISRADELAIRRRRPAGTLDVLARVSLSGGSPRDVLEGVGEADWSPDGDNLAVIRKTNGGPSTLEFPIGKALQPPGRITELRVSPDGKSIAVTEKDPRGGSSISIVDLSGRKRTLTTGWNGGSGLAWSPDGLEIWFTAATWEGPPNLHAVDLSGRTRPVLIMPSWVWLHDIARDGRVLLTNNTWRSGMNWMRPGASREQEVSWLDWSIADDLSSDGSELLFSETREGGGAESIVFLRRDPSEPPIRLGPGKGLALSPDGKWALACLKGAKDRAARLVLYPTGPGQPRALGTGSIETFLSGRWLPDGKRFVLGGEEKGKSARLYLVDVDGTPPRAITPERMRQQFAVSPDGAFVAACDAETLNLYPVEGGAPRRVSGAEKGERPIVWSADGRSLLVYRPDAPPIQIDRIDIASGKSSLWREITPADAAGIEDVYPILVTPDARGYVYNYQQRSSDLYVVEGLK